MITIYGIKNCGTMKKAMAWLDSHSIEYHFHDYRKEGLDEALLQHWVNALGWEPLVNRRGTTWRKLPESEREDIDETKAMRLMLANPSLIKRPVLSANNQLHVGFSESDYAQLLG